MFLWMICGMMMNDDVNKNGREVTQTFVILNKRLAYLVHHLYFIYSFVLVKNTEG